MSMTKLDALDVRRRWLRARMDVAKVAGDLNVTRQAVYDAIKRADAQSPLTWQSGSIEDREAMAALWDATLTHAHINHGAPRIIP